MSARTIAIVFGVVLVCLAMLLAVRRIHSAVSPSDARLAARSSCTQVAGAYRGHTTDIWLTLTGRVSRLLPDEYGQYRHQRFLVRCPSGQTVLVVNDVSIGSRVPLRQGDTVTVHGEYVWNDLGGLVHFTHHSDSGGPQGWIWYRDRVYAWIIFRTKTWKTAPRRAGGVDGGITRFASERISRYWFPARAALPPPASRLTVSSAQQG